MHTVLVTGAAGFIGSHLAEALLASGHTVVGVDNFDPFYPRATKEANLTAALANPRYVFQEVDLALPDTATALLATHRPTVVVHLAAKAGVRPSLENPEAYIRANITATQHLAEAMRKAGINKLVFASSSSVYGDDTPVPFAEDAPTARPVSPYAYTKRAAELLLHTYHHLYGLDVVLLRFFTVFGPRQRPDLAIHKFARLALAGKPLPVFGDGLTARDYTYVTDTVQGIQGAIEYVQAHAGVYEIVNLGNHTPVSLNEMVAAVQQAVGARVPLEHLPPQPGDVQITFADISKAQHLLGYAPQVPFAEGVRRFVAWLRTQA